MQHLKIKQFIMLLGLLLPTVWSIAMSINVTDEHSHIVIKESHVQQAPKGYAIQASIDGHYVSVVFTENLGQVIVEITTVENYPVDYMFITTPNGYQFYISATGDYIITFTLPDGDEYYGEFSVTD